MSYREHNVNIVSKRKKKCLGPNREAKFKKGSNKEFSLKEKASSII